MKFIPLLLLQSFFSTFIFSQIPKISISGVNESPRVNAPTAYDSMQNFLGSNAYLYKGQELLLLEEPVELRHYGYKDFFVDCNRTSVMEKSNIYKCCSESSEFFSNYNELAGKYFIVLDVIQNPSNQICLKLQQTDTKEICYFQYFPEYNTSFPFVVVGFYEKLKQRFVNKNFVLANNMINDNVRFKTGETWKCIDVAITDDFNLSLIFQNSTGSKTSFGFDYVIDTSFSKLVFPLQKAQVYKTRFGVNNWNLILQGKVVIGMTKEMATFSWGEPEKINSTITSNTVNEQWVYDGHYLYFKNGKLTAIQ